GRGSRAVHRSGWRRGAAAGRRRSHAAGTVGGGRRGQDIGAHRLLPRTNPLRRGAGQGRQHGASRQAAGLPADAAVPTGRPPRSDEVREQYTAAGGEGERPLVVAAATLPAQLAEDAEGKTSVLTDSCHEQIRYAGVLAKADSTERAGKLLDFLLTQQFQQAVPQAYGTYPVRQGVELPEGWAETVAAPEEPNTLPAREADAGRKAVLARWHQVMSE